ncbi:Metalloenzyme, LuxS/M16 peptidase-like protein [Lyophyllum atratum]|nr:Metalloenzyme, LuxS/M16 peptidase-like protein [Lyophyllum atratum]
MPQDPDRCAQRDSTNWKHVGCTASRPAYFQHEGEIQKSINDDRHYRVIQLANGLQALLIHDAAAEYGAACLNVAVGELMDPEDLPGLAHFCEHLLFSGTEQYPEDGEYASFVAANGGEIYACTEASTTSYVFSVLPSALPDALVRFSNMFHSPLFTPSAMFRELEVVDSEHTLNALDDASRIQQVVKGLCDSKHPWSNFGKGNMKSLAGIGQHAYERSSADLQTYDSNQVSKGDGGVTGRETRRRLIEWWTQQYCAGRMKLVILGKETLDELSDLTAKLFAPILNRGVEPYTLFKPHPYGTKARGTITFIKSVTDRTSLDIAFAIPHQAPEYATKPGRFLSGIVGYAGPRSLSSYLRNKGWISYLGISSHTLAAGIDDFGIQLALTPDGLAEYREVLATIHRYIRLLQTSTLPNHLYQERKQLADIAFRYDHKNGDGAGYVLDLAEQMQSPYIPAERYLRASCFDEEYHEQGVRDVLEMLTPEHARVVVVAKDLEAIAPEGEWLTEKWYGTEYKVYEYDEELMQLALNPERIPELSFPEPNDLIPVNITIRKQDVAECLKEPILLHETPSISLWHKMDDQFWVPDGSISLLILCPTSYATPRRAVMTQMWLVGVNQALDSCIDAASSVGFDLALTDDIASSSSISLRVRGYGEKIPTLLRRILVEIKGFRLHPDALDYYSPSQYEEFENWKLSAPYIRGDSFCNYLMMQNVWTHEERVAELSDITFDEFSAHCAELLSRVHIRALVHGYINKEEALDVMNTIESILQPKPVLTPVELCCRNLILPDGVNFVWKQPLPNAKELDSCVSYYCQVADFRDMKSTATFLLIARILEDQFFKQMRTVEQLGYVVQCVPHFRRPSVGIYFAVQSERDADYCESRIDAFLDAAGNLLRNFSRDEFESQKATFMQGLESKKPNLEAERIHFLKHIKSGFNKFRSDEEHANALRDVSLDDAVHLFMTRIHPASLTRSKLSIHMMSQISSKSEAADLIPNRGTPVTLITNVQEFKSKLLLPTNMPTSPPVSGP